MNTFDINNLFVECRLKNLHIFPGKFFVVVAFTMFFFSSFAQLVRSGSGANASAIQTVVDQFRTDLGTLNTNVPGSFGTGRREINWDGVPNAFAAPNDLPSDFFNVTSPRGVVFSTAGTALQVSANSSNPTSTPVNFNNINPTYSLLFSPFSAQRLFTPSGSNITDVTFYFPGSAIPAQVRGFGAVFSDVDLANTTSIQYFDRNNISLGTFFVTEATGNGTFSFLGISYSTAVIGRVRITCGNAALNAAVNESVSTDLVVIDDFIYGEPVSDQVILRSVSGLTAASIQTVVDQYRTDLGTLNSNVAGSFGTGRRQINWDGVPDAFAAPNNLPTDFFNATSPRGVILATVGTGLQVSANSANPSSTPIEFNNFNPVYSTLFAPFSAQRLFTSLSSNITDVTFFVPGSNTTALVSGFGSAFTDVDLTGVSSIEYFDQNNASLGKYLVPAVTGNETFSFLGISYIIPTISRVRITAGNTTMGMSETSSDDVVVMDDFIYGEPVAFIALPVSFTSIKVAEKNSGVQVEWNVAMETNTKEYLVEKSFNGSTFSIAGKLSSLNNNRPVSYKWLDVQPRKGINYYRIKAIDNSNEIKYSEIVWVNIGKAESISIYPNPVTGNNFSLQLNDKLKGDYVVRLYNGAGQTLYYKTIAHNAGSATETIQLPKSLPKGIYQLSIKSAEGTNETIKLVSINKQ